MTKDEVALFAFVTNVLDDVGFDVVNHVPDEVKEKYEKIVDERFPEFNADEAFQSYLIEILDNLITKIREDEGTIND